MKINTRALPNPKGEDRWELALKDVKGRRRERSRRRRRRRNIIFFIKWYICIRWFSIICLCVFESSKKRGATMTRSVEEVRGPLGWEKRARSACGWWIRDTCSASRETKLAKVLAKYYFGGDGTYAQFSDRNVRSSVMSPAMRLPESFLF